MENHAIWRDAMSMSLADSHPLSSAGSGEGGDYPQSYSWLGLLDKWLMRIEIMHQRAALRDIADDPHLLNDLGLTPQEALEQANRPFWR